MNGGRPHRQYELSVNDLLTTRIRARTTWLTIVKASSAAAIAWIVAQHVSTVDGVGRMAVSRPSRSPVSVVLVQSVSVVHVALPGSCASIPKYKRPLSSMRTTGQASW